MERREFIKTGVAASALLTMPGRLLADDNLNPIPDGKNSTIKEKMKDDAFHLSMAGFTYVHFDLDTTLAFMKRIDVHYLCIKDFHLPLDSTDKEIADFHAKLKAADVIGYAVGPIYMKSESEVDRAFAYAKRVGVKLIVGVPDVELLGYVDQKLQKEPDMRLAIHLHGPDMKLYPNAQDIWDHVKDLSPRLGMCLDIGHNLRYGSDSMKDLKRFKSRVFDIHMKDVTGTKRENHSVEVGRGIIDFPLFLRTLRKIGYDGAVSLEYEKDMNDPFIGIAESVGYFKAIQYATK